jgi:hypothetical protein
MITPSKVLAIQYINIYQGVASFSLLYFTPPSHTLPSR